MHKYLFLLISELLGTKKMEVLEDVTVQVKIRKVLLSVDFAIKSTNSTVTNCLP